MVKSPLSTAPGMAGYRNHPAEGSIELCFVKGFRKQRSQWVSQLPVTVEFEFPDDLGQVAPVTAPGANPIKGDGLGATAAAYRLMDQYVPRNRYAAVVADPGWQGA